MTDLRSRLSASCAQHVCQRCNARSGQTATECGKCGQTFGPPKCPGCGMEGKRMFVEERELVNGELRPVVVVKESWDGVTCERYTATGLEARGRTCLKCHLEVIK